MTHYRRRLCSAMYDDDNEEDPYAGDHAEEVKETIAEKTKVVKVPEVPDPRALAEGVKKSIVKRNNSRMMLIVKMMAMLRPR